MGAALPVAVTMGEPAGIGGEISLMAWQARVAQELPPFFLIDDPERLRRVALSLGFEVPITAIAHPGETKAVFRTALPVLPLAQPVESTPGAPSPMTASAVIASIETAVRLTLDHQAAGIVTNPIQKKILYEAGFRHPGHTEFLAALAGVDHAGMMLAIPGLRVVPVTVHVSLRQALEQLSVERIVAAATLAAQALRDDFGIADPRLAIAGVNPHAGEDGAMGAEEIEIVRPAIEALRARGLRASGPWPPDTMFSASARAAYDVAICHYHDQALIPLKTLDMKHGVNITLGLPFIRTSPDHGTALDIAGKGIASPASLIAAIRAARELGMRRA